MRISHCIWISLFWTCGLTAQTLPQPKAIPKDEAYQIWQDWIELELWAQGLSKACQGAESEVATKAAKEIAENRRAFEDECITRQTPEKLYCPGERLRLVEIHGRLLELIEGKESCASAESRLRSLVSRKTNTSSSSVGGGLRYSSNPRKQKRNSDNEPLLSPAINFAFSGSRGEGRTKGFGLSAEGEIERAARTLVSFSTQADTVFSLGAFELNPQIHAANLDRRLKPFTESTQNQKSFGIGTVLQSSKYKYLPQLQYDISQQMTSQNAYSGVDQKGTVALLVSGNIFWESRLFAKYERFRAADLALDPTSRSVGIGARFNGKLRWGGDALISIALVEWAQRALGNNVYPEILMTIGGPRLPSFSWGYRSKKIRWDHSEVQIKIGPERSFISSETFVARLSTKIQWRSGRTLVPLLLSCAFEDSKDPGIKRRAWTSQIALTPRYLLTDNWGIDARASMERAFMQGEAQDYRRWVADGSYSDYQLRLGSNYEF